MAIIDGDQCRPLHTGRNALVSLYTLDVSRIYPGLICLGRSFVRLALAGVLYYLRPDGRVGNLWEIFENE